MISVCLVSEAFSQQLPSYLGFSYFGCGASLHGCSSCDGPHRSTPAGTVTNSCEKKRSKKQRRKGKIFPFACRVPKNSQERKKAFLSDQCKEIKDNNRWERLEISSRKLEIPREHFMQRWAQ